MKMNAPTIFYTSWVVHISLCFPSKKLILLKLRLLKHVRCWIHYFVFGFSFLKKEDTFTNYSSDTWISQNLLPSTNGGFGRFTALFFFYYFSHCFKVVIDDDIFNCLFSPIMVQASWKLYCTNPSLRRKSNLDEEWCTFITYSPLFIYFF